MKYYVLYFTPKGEEWKPFKSLTEAKVWIADFYLNTAINEDYSVQMVIYGKVVVWPVKSWSAVLK